MLCPEGTDEEAPAEVTGGTAAASTVLTVFMISALKAAGSKLGAEEGGI